MKKMLLLFLLNLFVFASACSLPPERPVSYDQFKKSKGIAYYIIEDDPEGVLKVLNARGEVVVKSDYFDEPVYLQIFATPEGLEIRHFYRDEYDFEE